MVRGLDATFPLRSMSVEVELPADAAGVQAMGWEAMQQLASRLLGERELEVSSGEQEGVGCVKSVSAWWGRTRAVQSWTRAHDGWLRRQRLQDGPLAIVFDECYGRMLDAKTRRDALDKAIAELAGEPPYVDVVERLVCLRGVSTLTAFALTVELGDWNRFRPRSLGPFLGLTPSEHSSGERRRQGAITKAGNSHVRRLLVEATWHQRRPPRLSVTLERRRTGKSLAVRAQADRSARRLHGRWHALERRGKPRTIVVVAVARELAGHCWALATME